MRHTASRQLHAHWDALRDGRPSPGCDDIDPAAIRGVLASVFLLDVAALPRPAVATFRLSGTRLDALFGRALRGSTFDGLWSRRSSATAAAALGTALDACRPVAATARGGPAGRDAVDLELVLLPLGPGVGRGAQILGALSAAATPDWMGLIGVAPLDLLPLSTLRPDERARPFGRRGRWSPTVVSGQDGGPGTSARRP